jgi:hypothetical protein
MRHNTGSVLSEDYIGVLLSLGLLCTKLGVFLRKATVFFAKETR